MSEPFLAEIRIFGFNFAPRGWALCLGQLLPISQNTALFSLLGTVYGGNGKTTFALPNLIGNVPVGAGQGPGLSYYDLGQQAGDSSVTLLTSEMPSHQHGFAASTTVGTVLTSQGNQLGVGAGGNKQSSYVANVYSPNSGQASTGLSPMAISINGGGGPHNNMQPYMQMNFCIALQGIFPQRP